MRYAALFHFGYHFGYDLSYMRHGEGKLLFYFDCNIRLLRIVVIFIKNFQKISLQFLSKIYAEWPLSKTRLARDDATGAKPASPQVSSTLSVRLGCEVDMILLK